MSDNHDAIPFRWQVNNKSALGKLLDENFTYDSVYHTDLQQLTASILAFSDDAQLCFVGRSLDNVYDYLSGLYANTPRENDNTCLNISLWGLSLKKIEKQHPNSIQLLKNHCDALSLNPKDILQNNRPTCIVDVVCEGGTYEEIYHFYIEWAGALGINIKDFAKKLRFIGVTARGKNSPNAWRWQQHYEWTSNLKAQQIKNVSVDGRYWSHIADIQVKSTNSNQPKNWSIKSAPNYAEANIAGLNEAYFLYHLATQTKERQTFITLLNQKTDAQKQDWLRKLALVIKSTGISETF